MASRTSSSARCARRATRSRSPATGSQGEHRALASDPDLVILDVMLPGRTASRSSRRSARAKPGLPVIMLTARAEVADKVAGLDAGATDYITKPFSVEELLARVRAHLRTPVQAEATRLRVAGIELDLLRRTVSREGSAVHLSAKEKLDTPLPAHRPDRVRDAGRRQPRLREHGRVDPGGRAGARPAGCCCTPPARTPRTSSRCVRDLKHRYVDGLILASLHLTDAHADELRRAAAPVIVIGRPTKGTPSDSVRAYSRKGAAEAVRHLHAAGRRRIAFVNGPPAHGAGLVAPPRLSRRAALMRASSVTTRCARSPTTS